MKDIVGWVLRIFGGFLWLSMIVMFKSDNSGWVSDTARVLFYTVTSLGGLACFVAAHVLLGAKSKDSVFVVGVVAPLGNNDNGSDEAN